MVRQINKRGHMVADVSARLGVSQHILNLRIKAMKMLPGQRLSQGSQADELRGLKAKLMGVTEERGS